MPLACKPCAFCLSTCTVNALAATVVFQCLGGNGGFPLHVCIAPLLVFSHNTMEVLRISFCMTNTMCLLHALDVAASVETPQETLTNLQHIGLYGMCHHPHKAKSTPRPALCPDLVAAHHPCPQASSNLCIACRSILPGFTATAYVPSIVLERPLFLRQVCAAADASA